LVTFGAQCLLQLNPTNSNTVYASIVDHGVLRSVDGGYKWNKISTGLDSAGLNTLILNSKTTNEMFLKNNDGIFHSLNGGEEWSLLFGNPFSDINYGITFDTSGSGRFLIGSSRMPGIYTVDFVTSVERKNYEKQPRTIQLYQNYPNPFNPSTMITFQLPKLSFVSLKVYDVLGREVAQILTDILSAGNYSYQWKPIGLSSGIYFYRMQAGNFVSTKRLNFIK
jgi:hypothetical protein